MTMKKILLIAAAVAALLSGCTKPGPEKKNKPVVSKLEVYAITTASDAAVNALDIHFYGKDLSGKDYDYVVPVGDAEKVLFAVLNPEIILDEKGNCEFGEYEIGLAVNEKGSYVPASSAKYEFNFELGIRAYDENNGLYKDSGGFFFKKMSSEGGESACASFKDIVEDEIFSETRDAWLGKLISGGWKVGSNKVYK